MRKISFFAVSLLVAACGGEDNQAPKTPATPVATATATTTTVDMPKPAETAATPKMSPAEAMQKSMMAYGAAMQAKDAKKLAALYTDDAKITMAGMPDMTGRAAIEKSMEHDFTSMKDSKSNATRIWIKNDVAIVEWAMSGIPTGEMMGMKGNEKPVGVTGVSVQWYTPEGLIKEEHNYMDMGTIMSQMGVLKNKARAVPTIDPSAKPAVVAATGSDDESKNAEPAKAMWSAFDKGAKGEADFVAGMTDDVQWDDMSTPDTLKGKDNGKKYFKMMTTAFPDLKSNVANVWTVGDYAIVEGTLAGTQNGPFMGAPASKKPVTMHSLDIVQLKGGKMVHGWTYGNAVEVMGPLGMMPKAPAAKDAPKDTKATTPATPAKK